MKNQTVIISALLLTTLFVLPGCNESNKWSYNYSFDPRYITITTEPPNAHVILAQPFGHGSSSLGRTPLNSCPVAVMTHLKSTKNIRISPQSYATYLNNAVVRIDLEGYQTFYGPLKTDPNETMEHHIELVPIPDK